MPLPIPINNLQKAKNGTEENVITGWLVKPFCQNEDESAVNLDALNKYLTDENDRIVILYLHGSGGNRSTLYR